MNLFVSNSFWIFLYFRSDAALLKRDLTFRTALWIYKDISGIWKLWVCTKRPQLASYTGLLYPQTAYFHVSSQARCTLIKDCVSACSKLPSSQYAFMSCLHLERALQYSEHLRNPVEWMAWVCAWTLESLPAQQKVAFCTESVLLQKVRPWSIHAIP